MADAGWAAVSWSREYGGRGATVLEQLVYTEETTRARAPLPLNVIGMNNIAPAIMQYGTENQKTTLLPRMMRADDIWCQGMSEPEAGSDLAALRTKAVRDGDDFVVNGQKIWTSLGHRAKWCQLYVRTDPEAPKHKGISCLIVDMTLPGIEVTATGDAQRRHRLRRGVLSRRAGAGRCVARSAQCGLAGGHHDAEPRAGRGGPAVRRDAGAARGVGGRLCRSRRWRRLDDPVTLRRLGEIAVRIKYLEVLCQRVDLGHPARRGFLRVREPGQDGVGRDRAGPGGAGLRRAGHARGGRWADYRLTSRSLTIAGGTSQINKNITAQRVLGLPRK